ncbi:MAG: 3-dehydroquinate synthase [Lachnospiraceae bacterium]|nr:3-dehydroquinate synthase [Lachnospiraceae bacterium]
MKTIRVNVEKEYSVNVGRGLLDEIGPLVREASGASKAAVISDATVFALYGDRVIASLADAGFTVCSFAFPAGEQSKNFQTLESVLNFLAKSGLQRGDVIIALGGGVVGDLAGFAASVYMRGIDYVQVPTTLLAMVDSSVGGKTAVDLEKGKNLAGAFWQPISVICDLDALETLPSEVFAEGLGEVIKTDAIAGLGFSEVLAGGNIETRLEEIITACIEYKSKIVSEDELDKKGIRNVLNAGHTIGHCIEKASGYSIPHGKAVANGLLIEAAMAVKLRLCKESLLETLQAEVTACGLLMSAENESSASDGDFVAASLVVDPDRWIEIMTHDKKNAGDEISFILPMDFGNYVERKLSRVEVRELLGRFGK